MNFNNKLDDVFNELGEINVYNLINNAGDRLYSDVMTKNEADNKNNKLDNKSFKWVEDKYEKPDTQ